MPNNLVQNIAIIVALVSAGTIGAIISGAQSSAGEYSGSKVVRDNLTVLIVFPKLDIYGHKLSATPWVVSLGTGNCCATFYTRAMEFHKKFKNSNVTFLAGNTSLLPKDTRYGFYAVSQQKDLTPGVFFVNQDGSLTPTDFQDIK